MTVVSMVSVICGFDDCVMIGVDVKNSTKMSVNKSL